MWFEKGRKLLLEELEEESKDWMASPQEVDAVFSSYGVDQRLWGTVGGYVGSPEPTDDSHFWSMESHSQEMKKTYDTARELLLKELEDHFYEQDNYDHTYWTQELLDTKHELAQKAKLRAIVRDEGRKALLMKQRNMMQSQHAEERQHAIEEGLPNIPKPFSPPSLDPPTFSPSPPTPEP